MDIGFDVSHGDAVRLRTELLYPLQEYLQTHRIVRVQIGVLNAPGEAENVWFYPHYSAGGDSVKPLCVCTFYEDGRAKILIDLAWTVKSSWQDAASQLRDVACEEARRIIAQAEVAAAALAELERVQFAKV